MKQTFEIEHDGKAFDCFQVAYALDMSFRQRCTVTEITEPEKNVDCHSCEVSDCVYCEITEPERCKWTYDNASKEWSKSCGGKSKDFYFPAYKFAKLCVDCGKPIEISE